MSEAVQELEQLLDQTQQPKVPLRPHQIQEYERELYRLGAMTEGRDLDGRATTFVPADRGLALRKVREVRRILDAQAPRRIEDSLVRDRVARRVKEVIEHDIKGSMLPTEIMRRNPAGAVDAFMKQENSKAYKRAVKAVKRGLFALEPATTEIDHANLEKYRPSMLPPGVSTFMADAQIPGVFAQSTQAKANWPLPDPVTTAYAQAVARETKSEHATEQRKREMRGMTPEARKAWGEKMAAIRLAKKQAREAVAESQ